MRRSILLARPDLVEGEIGADRAGAPSAPTPGAGDDSAEEACGGGRRRDSTGGGAPIELRTNFDALAVYAPSETTGADGTVTVDVAVARQPHPLPGDGGRGRRRRPLRQGRVDDHGAAAADGATVGATVLELRRPVRASGRAAEPDRRAARGRRRRADRQPGPHRPGGKRVTVPANDRVEVRFGATTDEVGTARFRVAAVSGERADATSGAMPVYTPATSEAFATYGVVDGDGGLVAVGQPIVTPDRCVPRVRRVWRSGRRPRRCRRSPTPCSTSSTTGTTPPTGSPPASWRSPRCATSSRRSTPRACPMPTSSNAGCAPTSTGSSRCRTTTAAGRGSRRAGSRSRSSRSRRPTPSCSPGGWLLGAAGDPRSGARAPGVDRGVLPGHVQRVAAQHAELVRAVRAQRGGRGRHRQGHRPVRAGRATISTSTRWRGCGRRSSTRMPAGDRAAIRATPPSRPPAPRCSRPTTPRTPT
jgi:hypothetical protein